MIDCLFFVILDLVQCSVRNMECSCAIANGLVQVIRYPKIHSGAYYVFKKVI